MERIPVLFRFHGTRNDEVISFLVQVCEGHYGKIACVASKRYVLPKEMCGIIKQALINPNMDNTDIRDHYIDLSVL